MVAGDSAATRRQSNAYTQALASFTEDLGALRIDHGNPSLRDIEKRAPSGRPLSISALSEVLNGKRLASRDFLIALVQVLITYDDSHQRPASLNDPRLEPWRARWRELQILKNTAKRTQGSDRTVHPPAETVDHLVTTSAAGPDRESLPQPQPQPQPEPEPEPEPLRIFVAMPGSTMGDTAEWPHIPAIRRNLLDPVAERISQQIGRPTVLSVEKEKTATGAIHRSMFSEALEADVYIADLSGANPNVYLELGVRWALRDGVTIPICQKVSEVRYNASSSRVIQYGPMPDELEDSIRQITEAAVTGLKNPQRVDSPVRDGADFMLVSRESHVSLQAEIRRLREQQAEDLINAARSEPSLVRRTSLLQEAVARNPASSQAHYELGVLRRKEGRYAEAEDLLRTSVRLKAGFAPAWRELGVTLSKMGASDEAAIDAFDQAVSLDDHDSETWATLGGLHRRRARNERRPGSFDIAQLERSLTCYLKSGKLSGNNLYPLMNVARLELLLAGARKADTGPAIDRFKQLELLARFEAQNTGWSDPWALFDLADTMLLTGRREEGMAELRKAVALIPPEEQEPVLTSVIGPLEDVLAIDGLLSPEATDAVRQARAEYRRFLS
ncbi:tetratricopeptide repeat protein [Streptomyces sp. wa1063]|uniref:tetratricopeptide repeat-containing protein n=1 Tax=Streptomyces sp. wa1063 TaxID=1828212 RepID=UPI000BEFBC9B|nr:tetratricopeptide repeat protein [Streptomyces sp. wa1063]